MRKKTGMSRALRDRWVRALKSGRYRQVKFTYGLSPNARGQCCLGVLCKLMRTSNVDRLDTVLSDQQQEAFVGLNDGQGKTFAEIAAKIPSIVRTVVA